MILSTPWDDGTEAVQSISLGDTHLLRAVYLWNVRYDVSSLPWDQLTSLALRPTSFIECAPILQLATHLRSCKLFMHASGTAEGTHLQLPRLEFLSFIITTSTVDSDLERTGLDALTLPSLRKLELSARFLGGRGAERLKSLISRSRSEGLLERLRIVSKSSRRSNSDELDACRVTFPLVDIDKIDHWRIRHEWQLEKAEYWDHATTGSSRGSTTDDSVVLESD
ncbi:hypothetical protein C8F01DRAFT_1098499 [Mycena amicta]|nr:hypothetical protein C8F01DRAFT_1098499 [Mycena amicta]